METNDEDREPDDLVESEGLTGETALKMAVAEHEAVMKKAGMTTLPEAFVEDALSAIAEMALRSKRRQADLDAALQGAGLRAAGASRVSVLDRLRGLGYVDKVVQLSDGGVLLSVTALGLEHRGRARRG